MVLFDLILYGVNKVRENKEKAGAQPQATEGEEK